MNIELSADLERIDWTELADVIERAPLGRRDVRQLEAAFRNSTVPCFAFDDRRLIGAGRALSDRIARAAVFDVVVLPEYQGKGVGRQIMEHLIRESRVPVVMLYVAPGKEEFYRRLGFHRMKTAMAFVPDPGAWRRNGFIE